MKDLLIHLSTTIKKTDRGKRITFLFSILVLVSFQNLVAGTIDVKSKADTNQIRIGEQFHVNLSAVAGAGTKVDFPFLTDTFNHFEIVKRGSIDTVREK